MGGRVWDGEVGKWGGGVICGKKPTSTGTDTSCRYRILNLPDIWIAGHPDVRVAVNPD